MSRSRASARAAGTVMETRTAWARRASEAAARKLRSIPMRERIEANIERTAHGCWEWTGYRYSNGYAVLSWQGKQQLAHRLSYEFFNGDIPEGLVIDHLCRNKACVNPDHLEAVTSGENTRRAMRTHCVNGHAFDDVNTWMYRGKRYCRTCRRERVREHQAKKKAGKS